jgi:hypothetical protein
MAGMIEGNIEEVRGFLRGAPEIFADVRADLEGLVREVVNVPYFGPNATWFKQRCGEIAVELSNALVRDIQAISDAVRTTASDFAESMGGERVTITFDGSPISAPGVPPATDVLQVDLVALEELKSLIAQRLGAVGGAVSRLNERIRAVHARFPRWDNLVQEVDSFSTKARSRLEELGQNLNGVIDGQIESVRSATH